MITDFRPTDVPVQPPTEIKKSDEKRAVKISESVQQAQLVSRIEPRYPPLALQTRKEGTVLLHAIISREGRITAIEVVSGSPWFVRAALVILAPILVNIVLFHACMAPAGFAPAVIAIALWAVVFARERAAFAPLLTARSAT